MGDRWMELSDAWADTPLALSTRACSVADERYELESAFYAEAILRALPAGATTLIDYGCGVGRVAKAILERDASLRIVGIEESAMQCRLAEDYVENSRFLAISPEDRCEVADLAYCVNSLSSLQNPALSLALCRLHRHLTPGGSMIVCFSDADSDSSSLAEIERELFTSVETIFDEETLDVRGTETVRHHGIVYRRRSTTGH